MNVLNNKRGIEPVIATVLLIVVTLAVVGLVIGFLYPYIQNMIDKQTACNGVALRISSEGTCTNKTTDGTKVMVEAVLNDNNISKMTTYFLFGGETRTTITTNFNQLPENGGARTYTSPVGNVEKVWAIPTIKFKGKDFSCDNAKAELTPVLAC
jgi:flagellin-like protein